MLNAKRWMISLALAAMKSWDDFVSRIREAREPVDTGLYVARVVVHAK